MCPAMYLVAKSFTIARHCLMVYFCRSIDKCFFRHLASDTNNGVHQLVTNILRAVGIMAPTEVYILLPLYYIKYQHSAQHRPLWIPNVWNCFHTVAWTSWQLVVNILISILSTGVWCLDIEDEVDDGDGPADLHLDHPDTSACPLQQLYIQVAPYLDLYLCLYLYLYFICVCI